MSHQVGGVLPVLKKFDFSEKSNFFSIPAPWLLAAILCLAAILGVLRLHPYTAAYGDEGRYLMLAQSLRFEGRYEYGGLPDHEYPPGLPALLAGVMWLTGSGQPLHTAVVPAKLLVLALHLLALALLFDLFRRHAPLWVAAVATLAATVQPLLTAMAAEPMTDGPFLSFAILTLWLIDRSLSASRLQSAAFNLQPLLAGLAAGIAWNIRLVGVVLVLAGALAFLIQRRWLHALIYTSMALIVMVPWTLFNRFGPWAPVDVGSVAGYVGAVISVDLYTPGASAPTIGDLAARLAVNALANLTILSQAILGQPWRQLAPLYPWAGKLDVGFSFLLALLIAAGVVLGIRRRQWHLLLFVAGMQAVLLLWPFPQQRHFNPLLPFYFFYLCLGIDWLIASVSLPLRRWAIAGAVVLLAGSLGFLLVSNLDAGVRGFALRSAPTPAAFFATQSGQWATYFEASRWAVNHAPAGAAVVVRKPYLTYLYDGGQPEPFLWTADPAQWLAFLSEKDVAYVVEDSFTWSDATERFLRPVLHSQPEAFTLAYETGAPVTRVWRFSGP